MGRASLRSADGISLVETLIAVVILGLAVTGILTAFAASSRSARVGRDAASADTVLRSFAESVVHAPNGVEADGYRACSGGSPPSYAPMTRGGHTVSVVEVGYWISGTQPAQFGGCSHDTSGLMRVVLRATTNQRRPAPDLAIFVRKVT